MKMLSTLLFAAVLMASSMSEAVEGFVFEEPPSLDGRNAIVTGDVNYSECFDYAYRVVVLRGNGEHAFTTTFLTNAVLTTGAKMTFSGPSDRWVTDKCSGANQIDLF